MPIKSTNKNVSAILLNGFWFILSVLLLIYPALQNGYALLHADSGTYIYMGFLKEIPVSRPITYCWLVRHISLYYSIWLVIIFQGMLMASFITLLLHKLTGNKNVFFLSFVLTAILSVLTNLPIYVSHIMPDMYMGIALIGYFVLLTDRSIHWAWLILLSFITFYSTIVHFSNLPILTSVNIALVVLYFLLRKYKFININHSRIKIVAVVLLVSWLSIPTINYIYGAGFGYSRVSNIVFTARLIQPGIFSDYVNERCETDTAFFLCDYKNTMPDYDRYHYFLWHDTSFLYKNCEGIEGFAECWLAQDSIYGLINDDILSKPEYRKRFLLDAVLQFGYQLHTFDLGTDPPYGEKSHINYPIKRYFPREHQQYLDAQQQRSEIRYDARNTIQQISVVIALLTIAAFYSVPRLRKKVMSMTSTFLMMFVLTILANAGLIALLSIVVGRFQGRLIWILPALAFVLIAGYLGKQSSDPETQGDQ